MALLSTNFVAADHNPANWTQRLNTTNYVLVTDAAYTGGGYLRRDAAVQVNPWYLYSWNLVGSLADVDCTLRSQQLVSRGDDNWAWGIGARASGSGSTPTMYVLGFAGSASSSVEIGKVVAGVYTRLGEKVVNWTFGAANLYWIRAYCVGSALRLKFWTGAEGDQPGAWDLNLTDTSITGAGWFGLANRIRTYQHRFDRLVVDTAPVVGAGYSAPLQGIDWGLYRQVWWNKDAPKPRAEFGATATPCADLNTRPASLGGSQFPSGMVYVGDQQQSAFPDAWEQDVQVSVLLDGMRAKTTWWNAWREAEFTWAGVAALASGVRNDTESSAYGVFAAVQGGTVWPYAPSTEPCRSPKGWFTVANFTAWIIHNGVRRWSFNVPIGSTVIKPWDWLCDQCELPWITVRVRVTRPTDPADKKLRVEAGYVVGAGDVGTFQLDSGELDTRVLTAGGFVLPCGWGGWSWYKPNVAYAGGTGDLAWAAYKNLVITNLTETGCDEIPLEECPPELPECQPPEIVPDLPGPGVVPQPCPDVETGAELGLFVGQDGGNLVFQYGTTELDYDGPVLARIRPNIVAPAGFQGECWYRNLYVTVTGSGDAILQVTPVLDGERVLDASRPILFSGPGVGQDRYTDRFEVALNRPYRDSAGVERVMYGLRGTTFTVEIEAYDVCGTGFTVDGVTLEYEIVQESQPEIIYSEELLDEVARIGVGGLFVGPANSNALLHADDTLTQDASQSVPVAARSVVVAPEGYDGECWFQNAHVAVTRSGTPIAKFTPIVDGIELEPVWIDYTAVDAPVMEVTEIPLNQPYDETGEVLRYGARGVTFSLRFELPSGLPDGIFVIEGCELEYEPVQESEEHV